MTTRRISSQCKVNKLLILKPHFQSRSDFHAIFKNRSILSSRFGTFYKTVLIVKSSNEIRQLQSFLQAHLQDWRQSFFRSLSAQQHSLKTNKYNPQFNQTPIIWPAAHIVRLSQYVWPNEAYGVYVRLSAQMNTGTIRTGVSTMGYYRPTTSTSFSHSGWKFFFSSSRCPVLRRLYLNKVTADTYSGSRFKLRNHAS
ncbi:hypothetical protein LENED_005117 [Lentinula edodes]|uniref:Uncharacterized protein n=1 Tax=Lentinula edodes TaxID=5353 RepID=A0A1Q3E852_LENED|nr:hypothetical protein LENED_005117 [Lentinula edodes]